MVVLSVTSAEALAAPLTAGEVAGVSVLGSRCDSQRASVCFNLEEARTEGRGRRALGGAQLLPATPVWAELWVLTTLACFVRP